MMLKAKAAYGDDDDSLSHTGLCSDFYVFKWVPTFLKEYDPKKRMQRGVFFTPRPVVSFIVRSVDEILRKEFGLADGLADTTTWGEMKKRNPKIEIPEAAKPEEPFVQILDPACGTGTFLVEAINLIHWTMMSKWRKAGHMQLELPNLWNEYVSDHLLPRLSGFELMMAPYAIAHMKIGLKLHDTGYSFRSHERARIYLTNSLEPPQDFSDRFEFDAPALAHEAQSVNAVKRHQRFTAIIGNPPYSVISANFNAFIDSLMDDYKKHVRAEQGLVALADDYLKFIRLSQELLRTTSCGIWGMITNHGYLKGIIHRGVRKELLGQFIAMFVLDLHGDSNIGELVPTGKSNENVFDIQQGVAITIGIQPVVKPSVSLVRHSDVWGSRNEKYDDLIQYSISQRKWVELHPTEPRFLLIPFDESNIAEYQDYPSIDELMPVNSCGVKTHRDGVVIDCEKKTLIARMADIASEPRLELLRERYGITDTPNWRLKDAQANIIAAEIPELVHHLTYRPFDYRWIYYNRAIIEKGDSKYPTLRHMLESNLALLTARIQATGIFDAVFISKFLVEMKTAESSRSCTVFPLYLTGDSDSRQGKLAGKSHKPNLNPKVLQLLGQKLGAKPKGDFGLPECVEPEDIFQYAYAVFHSPGYRSRYAEFLKIDFPRLPLTSSLELFRALAKLGGELVALHLMESPKLEKYLTKYAGKGEGEVAKGYPKFVWVGGAAALDCGREAAALGSRAQPGTSVVGGSSTAPDKSGSFAAALQSASRTGKTYINAQRWFAGVPENVWNFHIGGYQVCEKWLKDRRGRVLSEEDIAHYQKIVVALNETIRLMAEIDKVIEAHGGWPGAFTK